MYSLTTHQFLKYIFLVFVAVLVNLHSINAQETNFKDQFYDYYKAVKAYQEGDTLAAFEIFSELFGNSEFGDLGHIYNTLVKVKAAKDPTLLKILIKSGIRKGASFDRLKAFVSRKSDWGKNEFASQIIRSDFQVDSLYFIIGLDSFLITEFQHMEQRDQLFRGDYPYDIPEDYDLYIDSLNFLQLKRIIEIEGGKLPSYKKLGPEGSDALSIILVHLQIDMIADIFPAIVKSIHLGEFFDGRTVLYQIDRNHVGGNSFYRYDKRSGHLVPFESNSLLHEKLGNYQYYGSMDISDMRTRTVNFWPFYSKIDTSIQQEMYNVLCVPAPFENPLKAHVKRRSDQEFIDLLLGEKY